MRPLSLEVPVAIISHSHPSVSKGGAEIAAYALFKGLVSLGSNAIFVAACASESRSRLDLARGHFGVATCSASDTSGVHPSLMSSGTTASGSWGRRVISPVRIFSWRVRMACSSVSGEGGHPGA